MQDEEVTGRLGWATWALLHDGDPWRALLLATHLPWQERDYPAQLPMENAAPDVVRQRRERREDTPPYPLDES